MQFHAKKSGISKTYMQASLHFFFGKRLPEYLNSTLIRNERQLTPTDIELV